MKIGKLVSTVLLATSGVMAAYTPLTGFSYSNYSDDGNYNTYKLQNVLHVNGFDNVTQIDQGTWNAKGATAWMVEEIAGFRNNTVLGYYDVNSSATGVILSGSTTDGANNTPNNGGPDQNIGTPVNVSFSPATQVGFYVDPNGSSSLRFYSQDIKNPGGKDQLAVFTVDGEANTYLLCWEDISLKNGINGKTDADYNDAIVKIKINPVPEPATLSFIGFGLLSLVAMLSSRRKRS